MAEPTAESIAVTLRMSKALGLARQGRLREAQKLLAAEGTLPESTLELHALAALATGEGDYARAQRLWRLLLQREPGHAEAKRMIDSIELWISRPAWFRFLPIGLGLGVVGLVVVFVVWMMGGEPPPPRRVPVEHPVVVAPAYSSQPPPQIVLPNTQPVDSRRNRSR